MFRCAVPEGAEVKLSADTIKPLVINHIISNVIIGETSKYSKEQPEGFNNFLNCIRSNDGSNIVFVNGVKVTDVSVHGKFMYWAFSNDWYMFCGFGMTGQWSTEHGKHVCLQLKLIPEEFDSAKLIYFNDPRHFGTIKFVESKAKLQEKLNELGWDPLQHDLTKYEPWLKSKLRLSNKNIGELLLDQSLFSGVGNYIRAEALYLSKISPWRKGSSLSDNEINLLCQSIVEVMTDSYNHQGATIQTYKTVLGAEGKFADKFKVYGKKADPLGNKILKEEMPKGRAIHWCPNLQK